MSAKKVILEIKYDSSLTPLQRKSFVQQKISELKDLGYTNISEHVQPKIHVFKGEKNMGMPKWFSDWHQNEFSPMKTDVATLKSDMVEVKSRLSKLESIPIIAKELKVKNKK